MCHYCTAELSGPGRWLGVDLNCYCSIDMNELTEVLVIRLVQILFI